jgi:hypothetical protein
VKLRPQLHAILRSKPGQFKSTILEAIGELYKVKPFSEITFPSAIGTVSQASGKLIPGLVWLNRNTLLLIDEFKTGERGDQAAVDVLLGTMETGYYKRKIGMATPYFIEQDADDPNLTYRVQDGTFEVQTRFSAIIATMKNWDKARSGKYAALTQRCLPIRCKLDDASIDAVLDGRLSPYTYFKFNPPRDAHVGKKDYRKIREIAAAVRDNSEDFREVYPRAIGDLCRVFAVMRRFNPLLLRLVCYLKAGLSVEEALREAEG